MWETEPAAMEIALDRHNRMLAETITAHGGVVVTSRGEGDSFFAVFASALGAIEAAGACQRRLVAEPWPGRPVRVRMGLHTGAAHVQGGDYVDHAPINRCARVRSAAHGCQVLLTKATADLVEGHLHAGFALRRLGSFRLRDLIEPELIFQLDHPELPHEFPPIRTPSERTSNLPLQVSSFVGRGSEQRAIAALLDQARVVTLTGPGGVGKTRLALEVAARQSKRFSDGVWLCELDAVRDPTLVDDAMAAVFAVQAPPGQDIRTAVAEYLRGKNALVVLDNCEHVLAEAAQLVTTLVRTCDRVVILATSREGLGIAGERVLPLAPLPVPDTGADLTAVIRADAVRLFAERAAEVKPGFRITEENARSVARIVHRLDGIALAIELAAARTPAMTPSELARRLESSFAVLGRLGPGADERHQTLRATIDWSFGLLTRPEQMLLCRMAVFAGDATLAAVEEVCAGDGLHPDDVLDLVAGLVARSLVVTEEHRSQTRYRLLETIRQYADERLVAAGQAQQWRARHARYYAGMLHAVRRSGPSEEDFWAARLSVAQDNLLQAWSWALGSGSTALALRILAGFAPCEIWST